MIFKQAICTWIRANLDPYNTMSLNFVCLNVGGINSRTTYVGESMHKSIKFGYDGIRYVIIKYLLSHLYYSSY